MKSCDYCGKANEDTNQRCADCGTPLSGGVDSQQVNSLDTAAPANRRTELNFASATRTFVAVVAAEILLAIAVGGLATILAGSSQDLARSMARSLPAFDLLMPVVCAMVTVRVALRLFPDRVYDTTPEGAAWVLGRRSHLLKAFVVGVLIGGVFFHLYQVTKSHGFRQELDPLIRIAYSPAWTRVPLMLSLVVLTPPAEELLFRGVMYGGFCKSCGPAPAGLLVSLIFVALHLHSKTNNPVAIAAVSVEAIATLFWRLRACAIGPAITAHVGYNAAVVVLAVAWPRA